MGVFVSIWSFILTLSGCLIVAILAFGNMFTNKFPKIRTFSWFAFFAANIGLAFCWFNVFFAYVINNSNHHFELSNAFFVCLVGCFFSWLIAVFFTFVWLEARQDDVSCSKVPKTMGALMTMLGVVCVFIFTMESFSIVENQCNDFMLSVESESYSQNSEKDFLSPEIELSLEIPKGGSLCGTLKITKEYALFLAKQNDLKYFYKNNNLIVIVQPGDEFVKIGDIWMMTEKD